LKTLSMHVHRNAKPLLAMAAGAQAAMRTAQGAGTAAERGMLHLSFDHPIIRNALSDLIL
jgi:hypothetical protein